MKSLGHRNLASLCMINAQAAVWLYLLLAAHFSAKPTSAHQVEAKVPNHYTAVIEQYPSATHKLIGLLETEEPITGRELSDLIQSLRCAVQPAYSLQSPTVM